MNKKKTEVEGVDEFYGTNVLWWLLAGKKVYALIPNMKIKALSLI